MGIGILETPSKKILYFLGYVLFACIRETLEILLDRRIANKQAQYFEFALSYSVGDLFCGILVYIVKKRTDSRKIDTVQKIVHSSNKTELGVSFFLLGLIEYSVF